MLPRKEPLVGRNKPPRSPRRHHHDPRRRGRDDQGGHQEDRRGAGGRPGAQRGAGHRRPRGPGASGGVGGGQGLRGEQADPGAVGAGDQRPRSLGGHPLADDRRGVPLLRGLREAGGKIPPPAGGEAHRGRRGGRQRARRQARRADREGEDQGRGPHRLRAVCGDHRHLPRHHRHGALRQAGGGPQRGGGGDDRRRLRPRRCHREAGRRRARPQPARGCPRVPRPGDPARRPVPDEVPLRRRHRRHVPGGRRHPGPRAPRGPRALPADREDGRPRQRPALAPVQRRRRPPLRRAHPRGLLADPAGARGQGPLTGARSGRRTAAGPAGAGGACPPPAAGSAGHPGSG